MPHFPLTLLTGASAGIGLGLAKGLCERGHRVIGVARRGDRLRAVAAAHPSFTPWIADLGQVEDRRLLAEGVLASHGAPDYLILNAGLAHYGLLDRLTPGQIHEQIALNLAGLIDTVHAFLPAMRARGRGRILLISSVLGVGAVPYAAVYAATKHGVNGFALGLRMDLKGTGLSVSAVCPAGVRTEFFEVATGDKSLRRSGQEPVERVVAGILRQIDRDRWLLYPTLQSALMGRLFNWAPGIMERVLTGKARSQMARELPAERIIPAEAMVVSDRSD